MALEQEIIKLVRLSAAESVGDEGFSSSWISIGSRSLIRIKSVSKLANCSLVLSLRWGLDHEQVEDVGLLSVLLLVLQLAEASSQLGLLSAGMILGPGTGETVQPGWIVLEGDLGDEWPL